METTAQRLKQARVDAGYQTATAAAERFGWVESTYLAHENGTKGISRAAKDYAKAFKVPLGWLLTGENPPMLGRGDPRPRPSSAIVHGMVQIDEVDVRAAGGAGTHDPANLTGRVPVLARWQVPSDWLRQFTDGPTDSIKIITVVGDSMLPDFHPNQRVMVNVDDQLPSPPGIFVVWDGLAQVVKRVQHVPFSDPPRVKISSSNAAYDPYERNLEEAYVQGRVIGAWRPT